MNVNGHELATSFGALNRSSTLLVLRRPNKHKIRNIAEVLYSSKKDKIGLIKLGILQYERSPNEEHYVRLVVAMS